MRWNGAGEGVVAIGSRSFFLWFDQKRRGNWILMNNSQGNTTNLIDVWWVIAVSYKSEVGWCVLENEYWYRRRSLLLVNKKWLAGVKTVGLGPTDVNVWWEWWGRSGLSRWEDNGPAWRLVGGFAFFAFFIIFAKLDNPFLFFGKKELYAEQERLWEELRQSRKGQPILTSLLNTV